jgi:hypothetical protein
MVASGALSLEDAYKAIDLDTITLLLGMMIVVANLRLSGFFAVANAWVMAHTKRPLILLGAARSRGGATFQRYKTLSAKGGTIPSPSRSGITALSILGAISSGSIMSAPPCSVNQPGGSIPDLRATRRTRHKTLVSRGFDIKSGARRHGP